MTLRRIDDGDRPRTHVPAFAVGLAALAAHVAACGGPAATDDASVRDTAPAPPCVLPADEALPCQPAPVPACLRTAFGLSPFYVKYVHVQGFPILSSARPDDRALCEARRIAGELFAERPALVARLVEQKIRLAIMATTEVTTDIPEHADLMPKDYWDERARGLGATITRPAVSAAEENLQCLPYPADRYHGENILIHELSHGIFNMAIDLYEPALRARLDQAYADAIAAHRFADTYAATNRDEYWAEGAQDWFDTNATAVPADGIHNEIHTRAQLETYDPALAELQAAVFGRRSWRYACPFTN